jgi:hypothetical protein
MVIGFEDWKWMELAQDHVHCICSIRPSGSDTKELVFTVLAQDCFSPCSTKTGGMLHS